MDVQVQVVGQITSKPTNNGGQKFDIPLSNGTKPSTFDIPLATKVSQLGGQTFTARIEQKPNPRGGAPYVNLIAVAGPGETLPPELPQAGTPLGQPTATPFNPQQAGVTPTPIVSAPQGGGGGMSADDKTRITKLAVFATAAQLVSSLFHGYGVEAYEEAVSTAEGLAKRLYTQARSHEPGAVPQQAQTQPAVAAAEPLVAVDASPQDVAAFVAEQAGQPLVQVGAEGVAPAAEPASLPWS